jgi:hypothetical protein
LLTFTEFQGKLFQLLVQEGTIEKVKKELDKKD